MSHVAPAPLAAGVLLRREPSLTGGHLKLGGGAGLRAVHAERAEAPIQSFATFTRDLHELADWLSACQVDTVAMESTGVYWIPVHQILEARGLQTPDRWHGAGARLFAPSRQLGQDRRSGPGLAS